METEEEHRRVGREREKAAGKAGARVGGWRGGEGGVVGGGGDKRGILNFASLPPCTNFLSGGGISSVGRSRLANAKCPFI